MAADAVEQPLVPQEPAGRAEAAQGSDPRAEAVPGPGRRADPRFTKPDETGAKVVVGSARQPQPPASASAGPEQSGSAGPEQPGSAGPEQPGSAGTEPPASPDRQPTGGVIDWLLVAFVTLLAAWTALVGVAWLPWYLGPVPMPVSALLGVGAMVLAPRACYRLTGSFVAALLPVAAWFGVSVWLVLLRNPMMRSVAVTVVQGQWRVMLLLGLGSLAAAATLTLLWAERAQARSGAIRPVPQAGRAGAPDPSA